MFSMWGSLHSTKNMIKEEFYKKYTRLTPLEREKKIDRKRYGILTVDEIYRRLKLIQEARVPLNVEEEELLAVADEHFNYET